ncbi:hypothetical protein GL272_19955 [Aeromonas veronii]|uniref:hypothetical protein n=1 Tax=Aeromonas TaxID=642 RepID=UPI001C5B96C0|nr:MULTISPECIES: hypothetical protein [Aeromonas]MBW3762782.1 hypothetical protein [Aeromonas jandaei]MBW3779151.1 hypothetical protein [Aeromonas veronii]
MLDFFILSFTAFAAISILIMYVQSHHVSISPRAPSYLIGLASPSNTYPVIMALLFAIVAAKALDDIGFDGFILSCILLLVCVQYIFAGLMHEGARLNLHGVDPVLSWWIDDDGYVHPHLMSAKGKVPELKPTKESVELLLSQIELVGTQVRKPIKVDSPFKVGYLAKRLTRMGWRIEHYPSTPCHPVLRLMLLFRRRKLLIPKRIIWRQTEMIYHTVLYPPMLVF